jgi:outer membrane receptor protein involved in Fe transport
MRKTNYLTASCLQALVLLGAGCVAATSASAQNAAVAPPAATPADEPAAPDVVVTGSRIARPNDTSIVPVMSLNHAELTDTGRVSIGDQLNDLPALRSTFSQQNSTRFLGTAGLNLLDLRGLGPQRTLVLVNGRRHVGGDILSSGVATDINTIPTDLIDRVDIVTGGDSAVYGSDAIAGVVNFVLKDHYQGLALHAQGGISEHGDAGSYFASLVAGKNFADGRGNIAVNLEYARQNDFYASDRSDLQTVTNFVIVDTDPGGTPNGSDGNPDRILFSDIRSATTSDGGFLSFASPTGACGKDKDARNFNCTFLFQPDGSLVAQTGTRVGLAANGNFLGGNGYVGREGRLLGILPRNTRYSANALGHFEFSPAAELFFEAKYVRTNTLRSVSGPAFIQGTTLSAFGGDNRESPRLDNPYLTAASRALITSQLIAAGGANPPVITDATRFALRENLTQLGFRQEAAKRETYRAVVGLRGEFNDGWKYEIAANYGEFKEATRVLGNMNVQRFLLAMDTTRNAAGQIVCRSQIDPAAARSTNPTNAYAAGNLANDVASCVPLNPFGFGNISQAARNYVVQDTISGGKITQFDVSAFVSGDTGKWFKLPGGPVGFAIGAEYRSETNYFHEDPLIENGETFYNSIPTFTSPAFMVKEAFAELRLPVLKNLPFAHELTLTAAGRVSDYRASGTTWAYNFGGEYAPIPDIRFRANYSRSVRAPNVGEAFAAAGQNFATVVDPCSFNNLGAGTTFRTKNCTDAGRPATVANPDPIVAAQGYNFLYTQSLNIFSGGNPNLKAETSDSYTYGAVVTPRFIPGLSLSVDYYNIKVNKVITSLTAQQVLNGCYDAPTLNNQFCALFKRNAGPANGPAGEQPFQVLEKSLIAITQNFASLHVRGIDVDLSYQHKTSFGKISTHFLYTHVLQNDQFTDPSRPTFPDQIVGELNDPKDTFNWNVNLTAGIFDFGYQLRYIGPQVVNFAEDLYSVGGLPPQNADYSSPTQYPEVTYHNVRFAINPTPRFNLYFGIDNVMNKRVPLGGTGVGAGTGIYEAKGRSFYAGVTAKF